LSAAISTAEWIGSGALGATALVLVAAAARLGAHHANAAADAELAAYHARRAATPAHAPAPPVLDMPLILASPPADVIPLQERTLQLHQVKAHRARHRKEPTPCS
jgi:hypothetical protein